MKKIFVGRDKVEDYICRDEKKIYLEGTLLLSSSAKDYLREQGVAVIYGKTPEIDEDSLDKDALMNADSEKVQADSEDAQNSADSIAVQSTPAPKVVQADAVSEDSQDVPESKCTVNENEEVLITKIVEILKNDYSINDSEKIVAVITQIMARIGDAG